MQFKGAYKSIEINGNTVRINGKRVDIPDTETLVEIIVEGNCETINCDSTDRIEVKGNVTGSIKTMSGDVTCGDVGGYVQTMSGDVRTKNVTGSISTMSGNIN